MPRLADAISKINVSGKNVKDIPGNPFAIRRIILNKTEPERVSIRSQLHVDTYVSKPVSESTTYAERTNQMLGMLDCSKYSEWAPWSPISRMRKQH